MINFEEGKRIAFLSDIHGNADALEASLKAVQTLNVQTLVILGDILTYGCQPDRTLDLVASTLERDNVYLVSGNHEQFYLAEPFQYADYLEHLPNWIQESVRWTQNQITYQDLYAGFPWIEELWIESCRCYVAHANPLGYGNWLYLNNDAKLMKAAEALCNKGAKIGIFGHTHANRISILCSEGIRDIEDRHRITIPIDATEMEIVIANTGAIGQPRGPDRRASFITLSREKGHAVLECHKVDYDVESHVKAIINSSLSPATKNRLVGFFGISTNNTPESSP